MSDSSDSQRNTCSVSRANPDYEESSEQRELPGVVAFFRPRYFFGFMIGFLERWLFSRNLSRVLVALPFVIMGIGGAAFLWWLQLAPRDALVRKYEQAVGQAQREEDVEKSNLYLKSLVMLRPTNTQYKFISALTLMENGQEAQGYEYMRELTVAGPQGFDPARIWMAEQLLQAGEPLQPGEVGPEEHLQRVIKNDPTNPDANSLLAKIHLQNGNLKAAESHLLKAFDDAPSVGLLLVRIMRQLKRPDDQIDHYLTKTTEYFQDQNLKDPSNIEAILNLAQAHVLAEQTEEAERVLREGLTINNEAAELRQALAMLYFQVAVQKRKESPVNRDSSTKLLVQASQLAPGNRQVMQMLLAMTSQGAALSQEDVAPMIEALSAQEKLSLQDEEFLAQALSVSGQFDKAISRIEPLAKEHPELRPRLTRLYTSIGDKQKADVLAEQLLTDYRVRQDQLSLAEVINFSDVLLQTARHEEARDVLMVALKKYKATLGKTTDAEPDPAAMNAEQMAAARAVRIYAIATIATFDRKLEEDSFTDPQKAIAMLHEALGTGRTGNATSDVLIRLVTLISSESELAKPADDYLTTLLAKGAINAEAYKLLGTKALELDNLKKARLYLERAYSMNKTDLMVLNNLAIVLVRQSDENAQRALELINDTLQVAPDNPDALSTRAEVLIAMKRWEEARRDLVVALPNRQQSQNVRKLLAQVCDALDETALANEHRRILKELKAADSSQPN